MGEEHAAAVPFLYFCDFGPELAAAVTQGRRSEFARFARFADPAARAAIPDPNSPETVARSRLDWDCIDREPHADVLDHYRGLLALRHRELVPRLAGTAGGRADWSTFGATGLAVDWTLGDGSRLGLRANLGPQEARAVPPAAGQPIYNLGNDGHGEPAADRLAPWSGTWHLDETGGPG
jgi:1,4-alpha-glucan branching enzyme